MLCNLSNDYSLRGYTFEYIIQILLRRYRNNNFIFQLARFDNINEILTKYRLHYSPDLKNTELLDKKKGDLVEFMLDDKRNILDFKFYEVKTKFHHVEREYYEFCTSDSLFFEKCVFLGVAVDVVSVLLYERWRFSWTLKDYSKIKKRIYSRFTACRDT